MDYPNEVSSLSLINPLSAYGFSGTKGKEGEVTHASHTGTGGGLVNKAFVESLKNKDLNPDNPTSAPNVLKGLFGNDYQITDISPKPPVIWFRGAEDKIISDTSFSDVGFLGQLGVIPGWPGAEVYPPQPMVSQTRAIFEEYAKSGGIFKEAVFEKSGHSPQIEETEKFVEEYENFIKNI